MGGEKEKKTTTVPAEERDQQPVLVCASCGGPPTLERVDAIGRPVAPPAGDLLCKPCGKNRRVAAGLEKAATETV